MVQQQSLQNTITCSTTTFHKIFKIHEQLTSTKKNITPIRDRSPVLTQLRTDRPLQKKSLVPDRPKSSLDKQQEGCYQRPELAKSPVPDRPKSALNKSPVLYQQRPVSALDSSLKAENYKVKPQQHQRTQTMITPLKTVERLYAMHRATQSKIEQQRQQTPEPIKPKINSNIKVAQPPLYQRVDQVISHKQSQLAKKKCEIDYYKYIKLKEQGQLTEDEILVRKEEKDQQLKKRMQKDGTSWELKYKQQISQQQKKIELNKKQMISNQLGPCTFNPLINDYAIKPKPKPSDCIGVPSSNRVEDRLMEQGKQAKDKQEQIRMLLTQHMFQPQIVKR